VQTSVYKRKFISAHAIQYFIKKSSVDFKCSGPAGHSLGVQLVSIMVYKSGIQTICK